VDKMSAGVLIFAGEHDFAKERRLTWMGIKEGRIFGPISADSFDPGKRSDPKA
jgi:hypothetical protein